MSTYIVDPAIIPYIDIQYDDDEKERRSNR
jgi:hypothetical protein